MELNNFQYTAPSNSSAAYFPNNKHNKFQVKVPYPITLAGEWEVALIDIQYQVAWITLEQAQYFILWMLTEDPKIFNLLYAEADKADNYYLSGKDSKIGAIEINWSTRTYKPFKPIDRLSPIISLPAGNYESISDLLSSLNQEILLFWSFRKWPVKLPKHTNIDLTFHYNSSKHQVSVSHIGFKAIQLVSTDRSMLSNLGFHYIKTHQHKALNGFDQDRLYYVFDGTKVGTPKLQNQNNFCIFTQTSYNIKMSDTRKHSFLGL